MGTRVPVQPYNLRSANSYIGGSLHDLNTDNGRPGETEGHVDRDTEDGLDNDEESSAVVSASNFKFVILETFNSNICRCKFLFLFLDYIYVWACVFP